MKHLDIFEKMLKSLKKADSNVPPPPPDNSSPQLDAGKVSAFTQGFLGKSCEGKMADMRKCFAQGRKQEADPLEKGGDWTEDQVVAKYGKNSKEHLQYKAVTAEHDVIDSHGKDSPSHKAHLQYMQRLGIQVKASAANKPGLKLAKGDVIDFKKKPNPKEPPSDSNQELKDKVQRIRSRLSHINSLMDELKNQQSGNTPKPTTPGNLKVVKSKENLSKGDLVDLNSKRKPTEASEKARQEKVHNDLTNRFNRAAKQVKKPVSEKPETTDTLTKGDVIDFKKKPKAQAPQSDGAKYESAASQQQQKLIEAIKEKHFNENSNLSPETIKAVADQLTSAGHHDIANTLMSGSEHPRKIADRLEDMNFHGLASALRSTPGHDIPTLLHAEKAHDDFDMNGKKESYEGERDGALHTKYFSDPESMALHTRSFKPDSKFQDHSAPLNAMLYLHSNGLHESPTAKALYNHISSNRGRYSNVSQGMIQDAAKQQAEYASGPSDPKSVEFEQRNPGFHQSVSEDYGNRVKKLGELHQALGLNRPAAKPALVKSENLHKKQGVKTGIDPKKFERCVQAVKKQGKDKPSSYAICNTSLDDKDK